jgi:hypothetical protein
MSIKILLSILFETISNFKETETGGARFVGSQYAWRAVAEVKHNLQRSCIGWVTKNILSRTFACFGSHVKPLILHL